METRSFNEEVLVQLTPEGERFMRDYFVEKLKGVNLEGLPGGIDDIIPKHEKNEDGWTKMSLSRVAEIFGRKISQMDGTNVLIKSQFKMASQEK